MKTLLKVLLIACVLALAGCATLHPVSASNGKQTRYYY